MPNKDYIGLIYTSAVCVVFFFAGAFGFLDYMIIKILLITSVLCFLAYLIWIIVKDIKNKKPLK